MFGFDQASLLKKKTKISEFIPEFESLIPEMIEKGGVDVKIELKGKDLQVEGMFNIQVQEVTFRIKN